MNTDPKRLEYAMANNGLPARIGAKWKSIRLRRRMRRFAILLVQAREAEPELIRYLEALEMKCESQDRELRMLRWTLSGEQMADLDMEEDKREWSLRLRGIKEAGA